MLSYAEDGSLHCNILQIQFQFLTDRNNYGVILTASIIAGIALLLVVTVILIYMRMFRNRSAYVLVTSIPYTRTCLFWAVTWICHNESTLSRNLQALYFSCRFKQTTGWTAWVQRAFFNQLSERDDISFLGSVWLWWSTWTVNEQWKQSAVNIWMNI